MLRRLGTHRPRLLGRPRVKYDSNPKEPKYCWKQSFPFVLCTIPYDSTSTTYKFTGRTTCTTYFVSLVFSCIVKPCLSRRAPSADLGSRVDRTRGSAFRPIQNTWGRPSLFGRYADHLRPLQVHCNTDSTYAYSNSIDCVAGKIQHSREVTQYDNYRKQYEVRCRIPTSKSPCTASLGPTIQECDTSRLQPS